MSWISVLAQTYDNCPELWGKREEGDPSDRIPLLLIGQSTQNAQIEVLLDQGANIIHAQPITDKASQITVIPCTEGSIGRAGSKIAPHPLHDKLQYVAGDYQLYGGDKNPGWEAYMKQIEAWCASPFAHPKVCTVRDFLRKGTLIADLIHVGVMLEEKGRLVEKPNDEQKATHPLLAITGLTQIEAFVRFRVHLPNELVSEPWLDQSVTDSFVAWQTTLNENRGICFVSGQSERLSLNHPAKLRHTGDKAKLISANDSSGFTFRGRFHDENQAVGVGYDTSQKAHNMLKWLISRHGFRNDSQVFIAWGTKLQTIPRLQDDSEDLFAFLDAPNEAAGKAQETEPKTEDVLSLRREYAARLKNAMAGYGSKIQDNDGVVVMGIDAATPGRMAVIFYREIAGTDFLRRIEAWHESCAWLHTYKSREKQRKTFIGAPAPRDIAYAAYGSNASDKLIKATVERLLRCIVDGLPIPPDIRWSIVRRAGSPIAMENWEWQKTLSIACAVVRKHLLEKKGGIWNMALDENNLDRSYLFGRLLAYAQHIESYAQYVSENKHRQTNAERMMHQFTIRPAKTWAQLTLKLQSYFRQLNKPGLVNKWNTQMMQIVNLLDKTKYTNDPLDEQYLLGYSSQSLALRNYNKENELEEADNGNA